MVGALAAFTADGAANEAESIDGLRDTPMLPGGDWLTGPKWLDKTPLDLKQPMGPG